MILILLLLPIVPPEWVGLYKYRNNNANEGRAKKITPLRLIFELLIDSFISSIFIHIHTIFGFKNTITIVIFLVIGFDVFIRREISTAVVTLTTIGIIALYLEKLIENGKSIKILSVFHWEKKDE